jgi:hypothetical protein
MTNTEKRLALKGYRVSGGRRLSKNCNIQYGLHFSAFSIVLQVRNNIFKCPWSQFFPRSFPCSLAVESIGVELPAACNELALRARVFLVRFVFAMIILGAGQAAFAT